LDSAGLAGEEDAHQQGALLGECQGTPRLGRSCETSPGATPASCYSPLFPAWKVTCSGTQPSSWER
jgi:hypothetical protein